MISEELESSKTFLTSPLDNKLPKKSITGLSMIQSQKSYKPYVGQALEKDLESNDSRSEVNFRDSDCESSSEDMA